MLEKVLNKAKYFFKFILQIAVFTVIFLASVGTITYFNSPSRYITEINEKTNIGYIETVSGKYVGDLIGLIRNGEGQLNFSSGEIYTGSWNNNEIEGQGILLYPEIGEYSGEYIDSKREGTGTFVWTNGDKYEGEWKADAINGTGILEKADGTKLNGTFSNNKFISGSETFSNSVGSYNCTIENGNMIKADINYFSGFVYSGEISNNVINGTGTMKYSTGDSYSGSFSNGKRSGEGTFKWTDGSYYVGSWSEDNMNGNGTYYYTSSSKGARLNGSFVNNAPSGDCTYVGSDGKRYTTTWQNGKCIKVVKG